MVTSAAPFTSGFLYPTKPRTAPLPSSSTTSRSSHSRLHFRIRSPNPKNPAVAPVSSRMEAAQPQDAQGGAESAMKLLFVEMGVGYDQHGQDITAAAVRACKDAISSNSIPAFRGGTGKFPPSVMSLVLGHSVEHVAGTRVDAEQSCFWFWAAPIPGVNTDQMKLQIKLGVPKSTQHLLDAERVKAVFP